MSIIKIFDREMYWKSRTFLSGIEVDTGINYDWSVEMNVNERQIPLTLLKLSAILGRLPEDYSKVPLIKENLAKIKAGYNGEKAIDYQLGYLPHKDYYIFYDIRLEVNGRYFQIDTLILTNYFILILEVKNVAGSVNFDTVFNQFVQTKNGVEYAYPDPILQLNRQETQLNEWLKKNSFPPIPIHGLVVISNPQTVISANNAALNKKVIHAASLPIKITQFQNHFQNSMMTDKELRKIIRLIKKNDTPLNLPILQTYKINEDNILPGVRCEKCDHLPVVRDYGYWNCPKCNRKSKSGHIEALKDYYLIFGNTITSRKLRDFLIISSPSLATRLISQSFPYAKPIGNNKGRIYTLHFDEIDSPKT
ncbi:NERD domain-containing protein [Rossellomorea vietnamensis]|jgi:ribosomal protein L37AE/L43A|uniref:NERD domain-containing protein n=1 Tax=Rossellomorea vietnamensis TaxID=218284 RepID=A0A6I6UKK5_9BACI|nr:nuclease-related domain-containing protein [Rossellomorea vietnamensis]MCC5803479.1 NERD domain-containing protein [Rossellomorea vietnamensis]QHE63574.1 NERD domain-containing protein [Rossellomorea vietnamensis]